MHNVLWVPCPQFKRLFNEGTDFSYLYRWWWTKNIFIFFTFSNIRPILKYKWKIFISQIKIFITNEKKMVFIFNLIPDKVFSVLFASTDYYFVFVELISFLLRHTFLIVLISYLSRFLLINFQDFASQASGFKRCSIKTTCRYNKSTKI